MQAIAPSGRPQAMAKRHRSVSRRLMALAPVALALAASLPAQALTISASFDNVDAASQGVINSVIAGYAATFSDPITVYIKFNGMTTGLGQSLTFGYTVNYADYITALRADATSVVDTTALASIPAGTVNPVPGAALTIKTTRANLASVGIAADRPTDNLGNFVDDSIISLNFGEFNTLRTGTIDPNKYDLQSTVQHEINEVLGTVSAVGDSATVIRPIDLFRYSAAGVRSFGAPGDPAYLSINGGVTNLATYNASGTGDTGDFNSDVPRVQNAFGIPGNSTMQMGVEITALDAVGFTVTAVPEPETYALMLAGLGALGLLARRRQA